MAGKKILTSFVLPINGSGGNMGNGTDGQAILSGGTSASMYWGSVPRIKTFDVFHDNTTNSSTVLRLLDQRTMLELFTI